MLIRVLYRVFRRQILEIYYSEQSKGKGLENFKNAFVDSNGKQYYIAVNDFDLPIVRTREIETRLIALKRGLSDDNLKMILDAMKKALNSGKKSDLAMIGHLIIEMEKRQDLLLHPDILFDIAALRYIREDENPAVIDKDLHEKKVEQFKKDSAGGLYDFFYNAGLATYIPYLTSLESDWNEYWDRASLKIKALNLHLENYITESK